MENSTKNLGSKSLKRFLAYLSPRPSELDPQKKMAVVKTSKVMLVRTCDVKDWLEIIMTNGKKAYYKSSLVRFNNTFQKFVKASDHALINTKYVIQVSTPTGFARLFLGDEALGDDCLVEKVTTGKAYRAQLKEVLPQFLNFS